MPEPIMTFVSYCHNDRRWLERLQIHLRPLERDGIIVLWNDTEIEAGDRWRDEIKRNLEDAEAAILLISPDFLNSDFIYSNELPPLLVSAEKDGLLVICVIVGPCLFSEIPSLSKFQAVNDPSKPLISITETEQEKVFVAIATRLKRHSEKPERRRKKWKNKFGMEFVYIPQGTFYMGSTNGNEQPVHQVTITQPFYMAATVVTQRQWKELMDYEPWKQNGLVKERVKEGDEYPAVFISYEDAEKFVHELGIQDNANSYVLPTEAQWEYAARAGSTDEFCFGSDKRRLGEYGWYKDNAFKLERKYAHMVARRKPNKWGLYDMHGNVWEWVRDWYGEYEPEAVRDPQGLAGGLERVLRGGAFDFEEEGARSAFRAQQAPHRRLESYGFRVVRLA